VYGPPEEGDDGLELVDEMEEDGEGVVQEDGTMLCAGRRLVVDWDVSEVLLNMLRMNSEDWMSRRGSVS